jgi:uncharacterized membrane protein
MTDDFENLPVAELKRRGVPPKDILAEMKRRGMSSREIVDAWRPPISNQVGSRTSRRRVVIAMYGSWLLAALSATVGDALDETMASGFGALAIVAVATMAILSVWLGRRTYINAPQIADRELDERLVQIKNRAYRTAFKILTGFMVVAWPLSLFVLFDRPGAHGITRALVLFGGVGLLATTLPTAIVAWREPDPVEPEPLPVPSRPR